MALCRRFRSVKKNTRRVAWPVLQSRCKALSALSQNTLKNTKTGRKSVGFLILTQAPKCTRFHCFPPQKHPKNGFVMRFAGKNSFFQLRARDFSFYMNAYSSILYLPPFEPPAFHRRNAAFLHPPNSGVPQKTYKLFSSSTIPSIKLRHIASSLLL